MKDNDRKKNFEKQTDGRKDQSERYCSSSVCNVDEAANEERDYNVRDPLKHDEGNEKNDVDYKGQICQICFHKTSTKEGSKNRLAFLRCGHCFCYTCLTALKQQKCPTCREKFTLLSIRKPIFEGEKNPGNDFKVNVRTLAGTVNTFNCTIDTTVEELKKEIILKHFPDKVAPITLDRVDLVWSQTRLINNNTLVSYGLNEASNKIAEARMIVMILSPYLFDDPRVKDHLSTVPFDVKEDDKLTITIIALGKKMEIKDMSPSSTFSEIMDHVRKWKELHDFLSQQLKPNHVVDWDNSKFVFAGVSWPPLHNTIGEAHLGGTEATSICHLSLKINDVTASRYKNLDQMEEEARMLKRRRGE